MGSIGTNNNTATQTVLPDDFDGFFGQRRSGDPLALLTEANEGNYINPNYKKGSKDGYSTNCALCASAVPLQARGYDVEALTQPDKSHFDWFHVYDVDYTNSDNYMIPSSRSYFNLTKDNVKVRASRQLQANGVSREDALKQVASMKIQSTPRGADKVAKAIEEKVKGWGNGAIGEVAVTWEGHSSSHAVNVINQNGTVFIYDSQSNKIITDLPKYFKRTTANHTQLVRLDNAPIKKDAKQYINRMFKKRGS